MEITLQTKSVKAKKESKPVIENKPPAPKLTWRQLLAQNKK